MITQIFARIKKKLNPRVQFIRFSGYFQQKRNGCAGREGKCSGAAYKVGGAHSGCRFVVLRYGNRTDIRGRTKCTRAWREGMSQSGGHRRRQIKTQQPVVHSAGNTSLWFYSASSDQERCCGDHRHTASGHHSLPPPTPITELQPPDLQLER